MMQSKSVLRRFDAIILLAGLILSLGFIVGQTITRIEYIRKSTQASVMPEGIAASPGIRPHEITLPIASVDSCWWILHTEAMLRAEDWRVRESTRDNAPFGREVHWSSGLLWILAGLAWLIHLSSGLGIGESVQHAALLAGPLMLVGFVLVFAVLTARRWGGATGGFMALALATLSPLDGLFRVGEADHHGIVTCLSLGCALAVIAAGAGRVSRTGQSVSPHALVPSLASARRWMVLSGLLGAGGLWVSAATMVPVFMGISLGALLASQLNRIPRTNDATETRPDLWRLWGMSGALGSLAFYLLEYAPHNFGWRLEVNHPLYAIAWLGGGDLLARSCAWVERGRFATTTRARIAAACSLLGLSALPIVILAGGVRVFSLQDAFLWSLHTDYIREFLPLFRIYEGANWTTVVENIPIWPVLILPAIRLFMTRGISSSATAVLALALCACLPLTGLSLAQIRWFSVGQTLWLAVPVVLITSWRSGEIRLGKPYLAGGALCFVAGLGLFPAFSISRWQPAKVLNIEEAITLVVRDVAWKLREQAGNKQINVLSGPTTTTLLSFFGDTQGVGTLYWENLAGLKAAGAIYGAESDEKALALCREHAVTHIVIFSWDAFAQPYARLHHGRSADAKTDDCFVNTLLNAETPPTWLRPLPYIMLPQLAQKGHWVHIFEVKPEQSRAESFFHLGLYLEQMERANDALTAYIESWNLDPHVAGIGGALGRALIRAGRLTEASQLVASLPPQDRVVIDSALGEQFALNGDHRRGIEALRRAVALAPENRANTTALAWLLATSADAQLRNGEEALSLMTRLAASGAQLDYKEINSLTAAMAETGNFAGAINLLEQALATAQLGGEADVVAEFESRRNQYASSTPSRTAAATPEKR